MKQFFKLYYSDLFLTNRLFLLLGANVLLFFMSFFLPWMDLVPFVFLCLLLLVLFLELKLLYFSNGKLYGERITGKRLSNGDENPVSIRIVNDHPFKIGLKLIDEVPMQFQLRDKYFYANIPARESTLINYALRPVKRGMYDFGLLRAFVSTPIGLIRKRYNIGTPVSLPVFPSFLKLRQYELIAISNTLLEYGIKKMRRVGHSMEFDQVKNYVGGDDIRSINWKATARKGDLMVNAYVDEKSQQVYSIIDKSRVMRMPFEGLSLLDYAINATIALSKVAMLKEDKAGVITISETLGTIVKAEKGAGQLGTIMQALFKERTRYLESNMEALFVAIRAKINQRSLIVFYTNFESMSAMQRQLPYFKQISKYHLLLVVFFENTELKDLSIAHAKDVEAIYRKTIAEKLVYEKKMIVKELMQHGILSILTPPQQLTINVINKYLMLKAQQRI